MLYKRCVEIAVSGGAYYFDLSSTSIFIKSGSKHGARTHNSEIKSPLYHATSFVMTMVVEGDFRFSMELSTRPVCSG